MPIITGPLVPAQQLNQWAGTDQRRRIAVELITTYDDGWWAERGSWALTSGPDAQTGLDSAAIRHHYPHMSEPQDRIVLKAVAYAIAGHPTDRPTEPDIRVAHDTIKDPETVARVTQISSLEPLATPDTPTPPPTSPGVTPTEPERSGAEPLHATTPASAARATPTRPNRPRSVAELSAAIDRVRRAASGIYVPDLTDADLERVQHATPADLWDATATPNRTPTQAAAIRSELASGHYAQWVPAARIALTSPTNTTHLPTPVPQPPTTNPSATI
jgi:hypothetical protein